MQQSVTHSTLFEDKWLTLKQAHLHATDTKYTYGHLAVSGGHSVAVLPYKLSAGTDGIMDIHIVVIDEIRPQINPEKPQPMSLTGTIEPDKTPEQIAVQEVYEEAGYRITEEDLVPLGTCFESKALDTTIHLFAADITDMEQDLSYEKEAVGLETLAQPVLMDLLNLSSINDPLVYVMGLRLVEQL